MSPEQVADSRAMQDMEDWLADTLQDSVDMDWSTTDGAKAIVRHWAESPVAAELTRLQALVEQLAAMVVDDPNDVAAGVPEAVIEAGIAVQEQADADHRNYVAGVTTDWDEGMLATATFKAMLRTTLSTAKDHGHGG